MFASPGPVKLLLAVKQLLDVLISMRFTAHTIIAKANSILNISNIVLRPLGKDLLEFNISVLPVIVCVLKCPELIHFQLQLSILKYALQAY